MGNSSVEVVAINDLTDVETLTYLFKRDSVHGTYPGDVRTELGRLFIDEHSIAVLSERDPAKLPWAQLEIDLVIECTGIFRDLAFLSSLAGDTYFQKSDFPKLFSRCLCSPAGGTYFQKSDFSNVFWGFLCSPARVTDFQKSDCSKLCLRCLCSPAGGTYFQKSFFSEVFLRCLCSPAGALYGIIRIRSGLAVVMARPSTASQRPIWIGSHP